ncbi:hypothetical protein MCOR06_006183 [Pyricularia oryzae]|nr:hypothetical protein MCOR16_009487 [Pyricularia oryzae]KAI6566928.1 hypothetical protein MCOR09_006291 [Pyricularia oryzae]KAI6587806.1 hypothetical protein MCOR06_006183 [Pyricularia oryzae]
MAPMTIIATTPEPTATPIRAGVEMPEESDGWFGARVGLLVGAPDGVDGVVEFADCNKSLGTVSQTV